VIALLHRADWTRLTLSGEVSGAGPSLSPVTGDRWPDAVRTVFPRAEAAVAPMPATLRIAPGVRYRWDDGEVVAGSDGTQAWQWMLDTPADTLAGRWAGGTPPASTLLCPAWLLTSCELVVEGRVTACGRDGIRVTATPRHLARALHRSQSGHGERTLPAFGYGRLHAIIDAAAGILLRCEKADETGEPGRPIEFTALSFGAAAPGTAFAPPAGSHVEALPHGDHHPQVAAAPMTSGTARTLARIAAGGLSVALRYWPLRFSARHAGGPGIQLPDDDPPPGPDAYGMPASDEVLRALYRGGASVPAFTATLHQWVNHARFVAAVPEEVRAAGVGGIGYLAGSLAREGDVTVRTVSRARISGWFRYQLERAPQVQAPPAGPGKQAPAPLQPGPALIACNGDRYWEVREDRVSIASPRPAPPQLADLADASWLLGCALSEGEPTVVDGRAARRLAVRGEAEQSELLVFGLPAVAVVDEETGRLLRLTCYGAGKPAFRWELRDLAESSGDSGWDFAFDAPAGHVRVLGIVPVRTLQAVAALFERRPRAGKFSALDVAAKLNVITEITAVPYRTMREYSDRPGELGLLMGKGLADSRKTV
jgi:hypothetical protein